MVVHRRKNEARGRAGRLGCGKAGAANALGYLEFGYHAIVAPADVQDDLRKEIGWRRERLESTYARLQQSMTTGGIPR